MPEKPDDDLDVIIVKALNERAIAEPEADEFKRAVRSFEMTETEAKRRVEERRRRKRGY